MVKAQEKITLKVPLKEGSVEIAFLEMRRPKVADMMAAKKVGGSDDASSEIALFASLTGQTPEVLEQLDMADYMKLQKVYQGFLS